MIPGASFGSTRRGPAADLDVGDVVTFRRVWHPDEDRVVAVVVSNSDHGPLLDAPDFVTLDLARSGVVKDVLDYDEFLGRDATGRYHLFSLTAGRLDVRTVDEVEHSQSLTESSLVEWARHIDTVRGWDELASRFDGALDVSAGSTRGA